MNKRAFTLIELMIVAALLSITLVSLYPAFPALFSQIERYEDIIAENRELTLAYRMISGCLKKCQRIESVSGGEIVFDNGSSITIENFGQRLRVNDRLVNLSGRAAITEIVQVGDSMFTTRVNTGNESLLVLWKAGVVHE